MLVALATLVACGDQSTTSDVASGPSTTAASTTTSESTTSTSGSPSSSTTAAPPTDSFDGATTPVSLPAPAEGSVALLTDVEVGGDAGIDRVRFRFADGQVPGVDVAYLDPPVRQDGSGDVVEVAGGAFLEVRMAPASGVDLGGSLEPTYTGPERATGDTTAVTEVVRTGDFEANLTWVIGVDQEVPFRVTADAGSGAVVVELDAS
jgi:guanyl-specific ribonuclease Sa